MSLICRLTFMSCARNFQKDKPSRRRKLRCIIITGTHPDLRGEKGTKKEQRAPEDQVAWMGTITWVGPIILAQDQMSSENYFKVFDRVHENIAQYASSLFCYVPEDNIHQQKGRNSTLKFLTGHNIAIWTSVPGITTLLSNLLHLTSFWSILAITSNNDRTLLWVVCRWTGSLTFPMLPHGIRQLDTLIFPNSNPRLTYSFPNQITAYSLWRQYYFKDSVGQHGGIFLCNCISICVSPYWNNRKCSGLSISITI